MASKRISLANAQALVGKEVGLAEWREVSQTMIDQFADATDDHQFIHTDPTRAAAEGPYGGTIAHGFLTLSLLSAMTYEAVPALEGMVAGVNFGFDKVRFMSPVKTGQRIRARFILDKLRERPSGIVEINYAVTIELEGSIKPALTAYWLTLMMPDRTKDRA
ncbi:MaoC family dehydratase [Tianweitania populi]|uniref:Nodulation protein NodN n=1 Tax=Tianweitania populi TaxID=1607949 RepID=A0A8J3DP44_9HYPH|nr:MaoC family dehydratase [Tianweitania populi]GHD13215.1 nodulation protein NodN [Tianweitania populi]